MTDQKQYTEDSAGKSELWRKGTAARAEMLGDDMVARLNDSGVYNDPGMEKFADWGREAVFGLLWTRPGLDKKNRILVCVVIDVTNQSMPELELHLRMARRSGWTEDELTEVLLHSAGYIGIPYAREAMVVASRVFAQLRAEGME